MQISRQQFTLRMSEFQMNTQRDINMSQTDGILLAQLNSTTFTLVRSPLVLSALANFNVNLLLLIMCELDEA